MNERSNRIVIYFVRERSCSTIFLMDPVINDPLLPGRILPADYLGQPAWRRRVEVLRDAGRQLRTFNPETTGAGRA